MSSQTFVNDTIKRKRTELGELNHNQMMMMMNFQQPSQEQTMMVAQPCFGQKNIPSFSSQNYFVDNDRSNDGNQPNKRRKGSYDQKDHTMSAFTISSNWN